MDMFQTELSSTASAPQVARDWLRPKLEAWDFGGVTDEADLLVTELVANVVTHVSQPMEVRLTRRGDTVTVRRIWVLEGYRGVWMPRAER